MKIKKRSIYAVLIIVLVLFFSLGHRGYKATIKQYVEATMECNGKKVVGLMPKEYVKATIAQGSYHNKREMIADMTAVLNQNNESFADAFGENWKYKCDIIDTYKYSKSEVEGFITISNYAYLLPKIDSVREVTYEIKVYNDDYDSATTEKVLLIKSGRKWYVADVYN